METIYLVKVNSKFVANANGNNVTTTNIAKNALQFSTFKKALKAAKQLNSKLKSYYKSMDIDYNTNDYTAIKIKL